MSRFSLMSMDSPNLFEEENRHYHIIVPLAARSFKKPTNHQPTKKYHRYKICKTNVSYGLVLLQLVFKRWTKKTFQLVTRGLFADWMAGRQMKLSNP